jgi:hypothetical protein
MRRVFKFCWLLSDQYASEFLKQPVRAERTLAEDDNSHHDSLVRVDQPRLSTESSPAIGEYSSDYGLRAEACTIFPPSVNEPYCPELSTCNTLAPVTKHVQTISTHTAFFGDYMASREAGMHRLLDCRAAIE